MVAKYIVWELLITAMAKQVISIPAILYLFFFKDSESKREITSKELINKGCAGPTLKPISKAAIIVNGSATASIKK